MSADAHLVELQTLGIDDRGISAETILYEDGNVTIQNRDGDEVTLDQAQAEKLAAFLVNHMAVEP